MTFSQPDRRTFLRTALGVGAAYLVGCNNKTVESPPVAVGFDGSGMLPGTNLKEPLAGGQFLSPVPFFGEGMAPIGKKRKQGHDARLCLDLASLIEPETRVTPNDKFYIRTEDPDLLERKGPWKIGIGEFVAEEKVLKLDDLLPHVTSQGTTLLECAGNALDLSFGLLSVAHWSGVPIEKVFDIAKPTDKAKRVLFTGFDERTTKSTHSMPGASWIFTFDDLVKAKAYLATEMNGEPLPPDHGDPIRLIVPNWYGCCDIKWLTSIYFVGDDERATGQMIEFAQRTHQEGKPTMAKEFAPATLDLSAIPVAIEKWRVGEKLAYRVLGISWGGDKPSDKLQIRFGPGEDWTNVDAQTPQLPDLPFGIWCHKWEPTRTGYYTVEMKVDDPSIRTRRLDMGYYERRVAIMEV
ncbi:MAG: molybdopterin-dependent oxidoreductase [Planctomycetaceae bacterium]